MLFCRAANGHSGDRSFSNSADEHIHETAKSPFDGLRIPNQSFGDSWLAIRGICVRSHGYDNRLITNWATRRICQAATRLIVYSADRQFGSIGVRTICHSVKQWCSQFVDGPLCGVIIWTFSRSVNQTLSGSKFHNVVRHSAIRLIGDMIVPLESSSIQRVNIGLFCRAPTRSFHGSVILLFAERNIMESAIWTFSESAKLTIKWICLPFRV